MFNFLYLFTHLLCSSNCTTSALPFHPHHDNWPFSAPPSSSKKKKTVVSIFPDVVDDRLFQLVLREDFKLKMFYPSFVKPKSNNIQIWLLAFLSFMNNCFFFFSGFFLGFHLQWECALSQLLQHISACCGLHCTHPALTVAQRCQTHA